MMFLVGTITHMEDSQDSMYPGSKTITIEADTVNDVRLSEIGAKHIFSINITDGFAKVGDRIGLELVKFE